MFEFLVPYFGAYSEYVIAAIIIALSIVAAIIVGFVVKRLVFHVTSKTKTVLDDLLVRAIGKPIFIGILIAGIHFASSTLSILESYMSSITAAFTLVYAAFVGWSIVRIISAVLDWYSAEIAVRTKTKADEQFLPIFKKVAYGVVGIIILLWLLGQMGVEITTLVAAMGIGGLAVALALQGTLSEFFAGAHIILDRPIKIGDYIELDSGDKGVVTDIGWRSTRIRNYQNNMVILPNSKLSGSRVINYYSPGEEIGFTIECGVGYGEDLEKVEKVTLDVANKTLDKLEVKPKDFEPFMRYQNFGDSNINFKVIMRVKKYPDQFLVKHEFIKALKKRYGKEGIEIAWPIRKVYMHRAK
jgi:small-conductance mechanosensitive channel